MPLNLSLIELFQWMSDTPVGKVVRVGLALLLTSMISWLLFRKLQPMTTMEQIIACTAFLGLFLVIYGTMAAGMQAFIRRNAYRNYLRQINEYYLYKGARWYLWEDDYPPVCNKCEIPMALDEAALLGERWFCTECGHGINNGRSDLTLADQVMARALRDGRRQDRSNFGQT